MLHGSEGDWLLLRADGAGQLDVRITIKTDDEALIYMRYEGIVAGDALPRVLGGEAVPPADRLLFPHDAIFRDELQQVCVVE